MVNNLYFFILGRNPTLSSAEITNVLRISANKPQIKELSKEILILEIKEKLNIQKLQERLGGTIKIGKIISRINADITSNETNIIREISGLLVKARHKSKKVYFGFSPYSLNDKINLRNLKPKIRDLALRIKKELKEKEISSRWVESREISLSSVVVQKNKLLTQGVEYVFLIGQKEGYLGQTLTCQKFEEYGWRDFGRPKRKIEEGMISPKLAKIMINLTQAFEDGVILDPFCGSGTILQEAILLGYRNIIGTDINEEAIKRAQENIKWLLENSKLKTQNSKLQIKIQKCNVRNLGQQLLKNSVDAIITEPYLGPVKFSILNFQFSKLISELSDLYLTAFQEFKKVLKKNGRVVIIFPIFKINNQLNFLPILKEIKKSDWQMISPIPKELRKNPVIKLTERGSIIYSRPDQKVLREIFIFTPLSK